MKKCFSLFLFLVLCFCLCTTTYAHSGKTDSSGGHRDSSTGEYHYHHGYSAHQHEDLDGDGVLDCPYNFKDKTESSSTRSVTRSSVPVPTFRPTPEPVSTKSEFDPSNDPLFLSGMVLLSVGLMFLPVLIDKFKK